MSRSDFAQVRTRYLPLLLLPCLIFLLPAAYSIFRYQLACAAFPYQLDPEEGFLIAQALELRHGRCFYRPLTEYPFMAGTYAPLLQTILACVFLFRDAGLGAGRVLVMLASCGSMCCAVWLLWRQTRNWVISLICPLFFYVTYEMVYWGGFCRVDLPAIFFDALGLAILLGGKPRRAHFIIAGMSFIAAGYTKQIQFAAPIAALIYFLGNREARKNAVLLGGIWVGGGALIFLSLNLLTAGQFYIHTIVYNANDFDWPALRIWARHLWFFYKIFLITLPGCLLILSFDALRFWKSSRNLAKVADEPSPDTGTIPTALPGGGTAARQNNHAGFFVIYWLVCLYYVIGSAKQGATANYFLEPLFASALLVGVTAGRLLAQDAGKIRATLFALVFAPLSMLHSHYLVSDIAPGAGIPRVLVWMHRVPLQPGKIEPHRAAAQAALRLLNKEREEIYCEFPMLDLLAGRPIHLQAFIMSRLSREGKWDQRLFVDDLARGRFRFLILSTDLARADPAQGNANYTAEMIRAMQARYRKIKAYEPGGLFDYYFYERLPAERSDE